MAKVKDIISQRLKKKEKPSSKMKALAQASTSGQMSSFSGVFHISELSIEEKNSLETLLLQHTEKNGATVKKDLSQLISITSEVKAINNQAAILHGERIQRAHKILTRYRDGAFTAWLTLSYGNRQTPYNFLKYFEFHSQTPKSLLPQLEQMPRQAVYTLASRSGPFEKKKEIVKRYEGETKEELLRVIRTEFPLESSDKRKSRPGDQLNQSLERIVQQIERYEKSLTKKDLKRAKRLLQKIEAALD